MQVAVQTIADLVVAALKEMRAYGRPRARKQAEVAKHIGQNPVAIRKATLLLNRLGVPVLTTLGNPKGMYLASTVDELREYRDQLRSRLLGNGRRMRCVNLMLRKLEAEISPDSNGQRLLWDANEMRGRAVGSSAGS